MTAWRGRFLLVAAVLIAGGSAFTVARAQDPHLSPPQYLEDDVPPGATAASIYRRDCAYCHGAVGEGTARGPALRGVGRASAHFYLSTGRMPLKAPGATVTRSDPAYPPAMIEALADHVVAFAPGGIDVPAVDVRQADLGRGLTIYTDLCAPCHVWSGVGGQLLYGPAPRLTDATVTEIAEAVRIGPGNMPAFGVSAISEEELNDVVGYVRMLDDPWDRGGFPLWHIGPLAEGGAAWLAGFGLLVLAVAWIGARG